MPYDTYDKDSMFQPPPAVRAMWYRGQKEGITITESHMVRPDIGLPGKHNLRKRQQLKIHLSRIPYSMKWAPYSICLICFLLSAIVYLEPQQTSGRSIRTSPHSKENNKLLPKFISDLASMLTLTLTPMLSSPKSISIAYLIPGNHW